MGMILLTVRYQVVQNTNSSQRIKRLLLKFLWKFRKFLKFLGLYRKKTFFPQKGIIQKLKTASFGGFKRSKSIKKKTVEEGRPKERVIFEDDPLEKANDLLEAKNRELRYAVKMKDMEIRDLKRYIDNLLLKIMENKP